MAVKGTVTIKNTIEAFKNEDKAAFIKLEAAKIWDRISNGSWLDRPEELNKFSILMFADLKKFMFYYWFAFPALTLPTSVVVSSCKEGQEVLNNDQLESLTKAVRAGGTSILSLVLLEEKSVKFVPLSQLGSVDLTIALVCVADPSSMAQHPGWTVRNLAAALCEVEIGAGVGPGEGDEKQVLIVRVPNP